MLIQVRDKSTGIIYSNDMGQNNKHSILSINCCTSYTQVEVQDEIEVNGKIVYPKHDIILPPLNSEPYWVDEIAIQNDPKGEWVETADHKYLSSEDMND